MPKLAFDGNSNRLILKGVRKAKEGTYVNNAEGLGYTLYETTGVAVAGQVWPAPFTYIAASNGDYDALLPDAVIIKGKKYTARASGVVDGLKLSLDEIIEIAKRTGDR